LNHLRNLAKNERGIAGVEAAVLVLSFFVVSSVLGLTVMSLGRSTSEVTAQIAEQHITETLPTLRFKGKIIGIRGGDGQAIPYFLDTIILSVITYADTPAQLNPESMVVTFFDEARFVADLPWSVRWIRGDATSEVLNPGELAEMTVNVSNLDPRVGDSTLFTLELKPLHGDPNTIKLATPASLDPLILFK